MNDTPPDVQAQFDALMAARTGEERLRMMSEMFDTARALATARIRTLQPDITDAELRVQLFDHFYRHDVDADTRERVIKRLMATA